MPDGPPYENCPAHPQHWHGKGDCAQATDAEIAAVARAVVRGFSVTGSSESSMVTRLDLLKRAIEGTNE